MVNTHYKKKRQKDCGNLGDTKRSLHKIINGQEWSKAFRQSLGIRFLLLTVSLLSTCMMAIGQKSMNTDLLFLRDGTTNYLFSKENGAVGYTIRQPDCFHSQPYASFSSFAY